MKSDTVIQISSCFVTMSRKRKKCAFVHFVVTWELKFFTDILIHSNKDPCVVLIQFCSKKILQ